MLLFCMIRCSDMRTNILPEFTFNAEMKLRMRKSDLKPLLIFQSWNWEDAAKRVNSECYRWNY